MSIFLIKCQIKNDNDENIKQDKCKDKDDIKQDKFLYKNMENYIWWLENVFLRR